MTRVLHIRAAKGGIADYGKRIDVAYALAGIAVEVVEFTQDLKPTDVIKNAASASVVHLEIGAGDGAILALGRRLLLATDKPQIATIHDPGVVVQHPIGSAWKASIVSRFARKALSLMSGPGIIKGYLRDARVRLIYLRPDLAKAKASYYVPQPTYHDEKPTVTSSLDLTFGFAGYWGSGKGIETLLEAWSKLRPNKNFRLVIGGAAASADDAYTVSLKQTLTQLYPEVGLPGLVEDGQLDCLLSSMAVLVLPYWPELPNGTSAMAMRAAELGVPIIASDVPALKMQLGVGPLYVPPKDPQALAVAMLEFAKQPAKYRAAAVALQDRIFQDHGLQAVSKAIAKVVSEVSK